MADPLTGGCLCGAVRYVASPPFTRASICHCSMCRKAAGAPYMAFLTLPRAQFRFTAAAPATYRSSAGAQRGFCARCGTALLYDDGTSIIDVASATLDAPEYAPPMDQVYIADAVSWADGVPGLP
ncbi:MAG: GFA family protein, partial [Rubritepida sp.]|nr:GFA family protein [Rubritepida sp.]